jgi:hypothetical protein
MARPKGSTNKPKLKSPLKDKQLKDIFTKAEVERLKGLLARQDAAVEQAKDQISDLMVDVEFYRKQINHFLALVNILAKGQ